MYNQRVVDNTFIFILNLLCILGKESCRSRAEKLLSVIIGDNKKKYLVEVQSCVDF